MEQVDLPTYLSKTAHKYKGIWGCGQPKKYTGNKITNLDQKIVMSKKTVTPKSQKSSPITSPKTLPVFSSQVRFKTQELK